MKELKFPVEIFPTEKKVLQIKEGVYWVKLLLPSMISHVNAYILDDEHVSCVSVAFLPMYRIL